MTDTDKEARLVQRCVDDINRRIRLDGNSPRQAYDLIREEYDDLEMGLNAYKALESAFKEVTAQIQNIEKLSIVSSVRSKREHWYTGPGKESRAWTAYKHRLSEKGWEATIPSIDESSTAVVAELHNPGISKFSGRGLVLGYVQSGKTANMTGVIAKAADAGYSLIIVLTGMIEKLRKQTQDRLQIDLLNREDSGSWHYWTTTDADFVHPTNPGFQFDSQSRNIMVLKKNTNVLGRLLDKLENTSGPELLKTPVLIIDDECDQASVNATGKSDAWSIINGHIRRLLQFFPRASYVGYTATPFANVLIDPTINPERPEDLYPRDFIYPLPKPEAYFGAEKIFGRDPLDGEESQDPTEELNLIREIPDDEITMLRPDMKKGEHFEVTDSLREAMEYFLIATALRDLRGDRDQHSTMLVHTSQLVDHHREIHNSLKKSFGRIQQELDIGDEKIKARLKEIWTKEAGFVPPELFGHKRVSFDDLFNQIKLTSQDIEFVIENSGGETERVDYDSGEDGLGKRYICVGGNVLARGLTLEGLVVSFFLRTSKQYDTLMQMGRWFGYRQGYEDLTRVWMTAEMADNFKDLATVEAEIRNEIDRIRRAERTPIDLAVPIRKIPGLAITSKNKMYAAKVVNLSFSGTHRQTFRFYHKDPSILKSNAEAGARLLERASAESSKEYSDQGIVFRSINRNTVLEFLNAYQIHESQIDLVDGDRNHLSEYIQRCSSKNPDSLSRWNIGLVQKKRMSESDPRISLGPIEGIGLITRSLFRRLESGDADIKALMSKSDLKIDIKATEGIANDWNEIKKARQEGEGSNCPLLILYIIDKDSSPAPRKNKDGQEISGSRKPLEAIDHVLGFGIVFPDMPGESEASYQVEVSLPDWDDAEEAMEEEVDQPG